jgi:hypothetical protein
MTKPYPLQTRNLVARMKMISGMSYRKIQTLTCIPKTTLHRWMCNNAIHNRRQQRNHKLRKFNDTVKQALRDIVASNPFLTYADLRKHIRSIAPDSVPSSNGTMHVWLKRRLHVSRKRVSARYVVNDERVQARCESFKDQLEGVCMTDLVSIDEMSVYFSEHSRYGYAPKGLPVRCRKDANWRQRGARRVTVLMAISGTRVLHHDVFEGSCNGDRFH